ncbi:deoxyribonuclease IV [candidate division KSB1 bacterium]|nr:MAG: deoxyribonuclease IV [candidate division KSB1 bacterium]
MGLLGAHVSVSGGIEKAFERGEAIGCDAVQIFSKNQRQWKAPPLEEQTAEKFKTTRANSSVKEVVIHDSYLINLAHPEKEPLLKSINAMLDEIQRAELLGVRYLVFHPGSHLGRGLKIGIDTIAGSLNYIFDHTDSENVILLLETTAGQGTNIGFRFEHLSEIMENVKQQNRLGVCFDTAHTFESGYDFRTQEGYTRVFDKFEDVIGLDRLKVFHLNDSKTDLASRVDRHENIGSGFIGLNAFDYLVNDKRFGSVPMILETPGGENKFKENLALLRSLVK